MAEAEENRGKRQLDSMQMNGYSRDLLNKFMNKDHGHGKFQEIANEGDDKIELDLGLSLNGIFGVDPAAKGLQRSSSITNFVFGTGSNSNNGGSSNNPLPRTCSLPVETEEESRKRKELQCLRRFEAKKKRMEKLQNVNNKVVVNDKVDYEENGHYCYVNSLVMSQGSMGSQGSGSSGLSDFGSQPLQGPGDVRKTSNHITVPGDITEANAGDITEANAGDITEASAATTVKSSEPEQKQVATQAETTSAKSPNVSGTTAGKEAKEMFPVATQAATTSAKLPSVSGSTTSKEAKEMFKNFMLNMPCVSTRGDGPNGRHIEGFLYRYRKGEEVRIVCVCHGNFLSPAEFVKHAGGCDVENPLRHIVVNPTPPLE